MMDKFRILREYELPKMRDGFYLWLAYRLPHRLMFWAFIRGCSIATTGEYGNTVPSDLDIMTALKRIDPIKTERGSH